MPDFLVILTYQAERAVRVRASDKSNADKAACAILRSKPGMVDAKVISAECHLIPDEEEDE